MEITTVADESWAVEVIEATEAVESLALDDIKFHGGFLKRSKHILKISKLIGESEKK